MTDILGTIANLGIIQINSASGNDTFVQVDDTTVTLTGGGVVQLNSPSASTNFFAVIQQTSGGDTLTNVNNTIQGAGIIGNKWIEHRQPVCGNDPR